MIHEKIELLSHTSSITIRKLKNLGINTYWDLLNYFPNHYENYSQVLTIKDIENEQTVTIKGTIIDSKYQISRSRLKIQKFIIDDSTGTLDLIFFNQPYLLSLLKRGTKLAVSGLIKKVGNKFQMSPLEYEVVPPTLQYELKHTGRLLPIYSEKKGISSKTIREKMWNIIHQLSLQSEIKEYMPDKIIQFNELIEESQAYAYVHFPETFNQVNNSKKRLSFDELFLTQLSTHMTKMEWKKKIVGNKFQVTKYNKYIHSFISHLPFELTNAQQKVVNEILSDLSKDTPMNRFLQGEVGSGKTVVAIISAYVSYLNDFQTLIMAPTEILAKQHLNSIGNIVNSSLTNNTSFSKINKPVIKLLTSSSKISSKELKSADIIIGTHALIQKNISYDNVGLIIIDEQHRFGVNQRSELKNKGKNPHLLTMTATPIPRTVMLTIFNELDVSIIDELPKGRIPIKSYYIPKSKRTKCYEWIKKNIDEKGIQVFIICPLIDESNIETLASIKAVKNEFEYLKSTIFKNYSVGLLHGKLTSLEKEDVMNDFIKNKIQILLSTSIVEVGVDIPNASIMIIEGSERFGLAQLHQLRGRVGRGNKLSFCLLFTENENLQIIEKLRFFSKTTKGNELAEKDLQIRGPGNIYGTEQHGYIDLKIASLTDYQLIEMVNKSVHYFINNYDINKSKVLQNRLKEYNTKKISQD